MKLTSTYLAALRALLVLTLVTGLAYPLAVTAVAQLPGLSGRADGSLLHSGGHVVGSALIGQAFTDAGGHPLPQYLQSRPSAAGAGYDPLASGASNLGPQDVVDTPADPAAGTAARAGLLSQVCARSRAVGELEGVSEARPGCPARDASASDTDAADADTGGVPAVPPDAVTASASGLDPQISPAYARLQAGRIARTRGIDEPAVLAVIDRHTHAPLLGFLGAPAVDVLAVNLDLDRADPT
jgi:K+-transporting ATPase ATPase C chain